MSEYIKEKLVPVTMSYKCDVCRMGDMINSKTDMMVLMSYPPQYPHKCNNCGDIKNFMDVMYPSVKLITKKEYNERNM